MKLKRNRLVLFVMVLLLCAVTLLFASCQEGVGPANPFNSDKTATQNTATSSTTTNNTSSNSNTNVSQSTGTTNTPANPLTSLLGTLGLPLILVAAFYFILIRPQKKKEKQTSKMRNELQIGDEITTIGGIIGKVVQIKDQDQIVIETGSDKNRIRIKRWAIQEKNTISD